MNTVTLGLFVNEAVRMLEKGLSYTQTIKELNSLKKTGRIYFTVGSLEYLVKNGRIGKLATIAGDKLNIKPLIIMKDGDISLGGITRSREKVKKNIFKLINAFFHDNHISKDDYTFTVGTGFDYEEAALFQAEFEETCGITCNKEIKALIGTTIGCHTGPHPLGIGFIKRYQ